MNFLSVGRRSPFVPQIFPFFFFASFLQFNFIIFQLQFSTVWWKPIKWSRKRFDQQQQTAAAENKMVFIFLYVSFWYSLLAVLPLPSALLTSSMQFFFRWFFFSHFKMNNEIVIFHWKLTWDCFDNFHAKPQSRSRNHKWNLQITSG